MPEQKKKFPCINVTVQHIHGATFYGYVEKQNERKKVFFLQPKKKCGLRFTHCRTVNDSRNLLILLNPVHHYGTFPVFSIKYHMLFKESIVRIELECWFCEPDPEYKNKTLDVSI